MSRGALRQNKLRRNFFKSSSGETIFTPPAALQRSIRERSWTSKCNAAVCRYDELRLDLRIGWEAPGYLRNWAALWQR